MIKILSIEQWEKGKEPEEYISYNEKNVLINHGPNIYDAVVIKYKKHTISIEKYYNKEIIIKCIIKSKEPDTSLLKKVINYKEIINNKSYYNLLQKIINLCLLGFYKTGDKIYNKDLKKWLLNP